MSLSKYQSNNKYQSNKRLTEKIGESIRHGKIFHAYIIEGDSFSGKESFARELCKAIMCLEKPGEGCDRCVNCRKIDHDNYEDLHLVEADGLSVKDEQISRLQEELKKKPIGERNLAIIKDADTMTTRAQNRLLKTLEEPSAGTVIILLSENRENLLETIKSRCVIYRLEEADDFLWEEVLNGLATDDGSGEGMRRYAELVQTAEAIFEAVSEEKPFREIKQILAAGMKSREDAFMLLDGMERIYEGLLVGRDERRKLKRRAEIIRGIELIEEARRDLIAKVNYQYAVKNLILKIGGL